MSEQKPISILPSDPIASGERHSPQRQLDEMHAAIETIRDVVQSQAQTQLEVYSAVTAMRADMGKMRGELFARIPPGYRWASLCCLVLIALSLMRIAFVPAEPSEKREDTDAVQTARAGGAR